MGFGMFQWFSVSSGDLMPCCSYCYWITLLAAQLYTNLAFLDKPQIQIKEEKNVWSWKSMLGKEDI